MVATPGGILAETSTCPLSVATPYAITKIGILKVDCVIPGALNSLSIVWAAKKAFGKNFA